MVCRNICQRIGVTFVSHPYFLGILPPSLHDHRITRSGYPRHIIEARLFPLENIYAYKNPITIIWESLPTTGKTKANDIDDSIPINSSTLRNAIQRGVSVLGRAAIDSIIEDLERHGIDLNDPSPRYTLRQLEVVFTQIFGVDVTQLLMERIRQELNR